MGNIGYPQNIDCSFSYKVCVSKVHNFRDIGAFPKYTIPIFYDKGVGIDLYARHVGLNDLMF